MQVFNKIIGFFKYKQNNKLKVVLDTNVFVGAYWNKKSASRKIIDAIRGRKLVLLYFSIYQKITFLYYKENASYSGIFKP